MASYRVRIKDNELGPFDVKELVDMVHKGELSQEDFFLDSESQWMPIKDNAVLMAELFADSDEKPPLFKLKEPPSFPSADTLAPKKKEKPPEEVFEQKINTQAKRSEDEEPAPLPGPASIRPSSLRANRADEPTGVNEPALMPSFRLKEPEPPPQPQFEPVADVPAKPAVALTPTSAEGDKPKMPTLKVDTDTSGLKKSAPKMKPIGRPAPVRKPTKPAPYTTPSFVVPLLGFCFLLSLVSILLPVLGSLQELPTILINREYASLIQHPYLLIVMLNVIIAIMAMMSQYSSLDSIPFVAMLNFGYLGILYASWGAWFAFLIVAIASVSAFLASSAAAIDSKMGPIYTFLSAIGFGSLAFLTVLM